MTDFVSASVFVFVEASAVIGSHCGSKNDKGGEGEAHVCEFTQLYNRMAISVVVETVMNEVGEIPQR
jgi:hypothetical protein